MTAQLPSKVRLAQIASFTKSMALPPSHDEIEAMASALLAAHEQEPAATVFKSGGSAKVIMIGADLADGYTDLFSHPAPVPAVPKTISVRTAMAALDDADSVTTLAQAYKMGWNSCVAAMLNGGKS